MAKVDLRADGKFILPGKNEPSFVCEDLYLLRQKGSPGERMSQSCVARLFARTSFLLTRLFTSIGWSGISPAQIAYIPFLCLLGVRRRTFGYYSQRCLGEILL